MRIKMRIFSELARITSETMLSEVFQHYKIYIYLYVESKKYFNYLLSYCDCQVVPCRSPLFRIKGVFRFEICHLHHSIQSSFPRATTRSMTSCVASPWSDVPVPSSSRILLQEMPPHFLPYIIVLDVLECLVSPADQHSIFVSVAFYLHILQT